MYEHITDNIRRIEYLTNTINKDMSNLERIKENKKWLIEKGMPMRENCDDDLCNLNITWNYFKEYGYGKGTFKGTIPFSSKEFQFKILDLYIEYLETEITTLKKELKELSLNL